MSGPFGVARCIAINASRGKNPYLPARKALAKAVAKLAKTTGGDAFAAWAGDKHGNDITMTDAEVRLVRGEAVTVRVKSWTRYPEDFMDAGEGTVHEAAVTL